MELAVVRYEDSVLYQIKVNSRLKAGIQEKASNEDTDTEFLFA